ncbi:MAG: Nif11-like leader peptide family natural product precursor [Chitinophagaceae bacterium]|jgi:predicted ribosomally synthesized peptide with nif11-like leader|nr:Nif11-like leader peptide family natural product precursor [Chitinophagaceae bacterium]
MSEEQLTALLAKLKEDAGLRQRLQAAESIDAAIAIAKEAGFDATNEDWLRYTAKSSPLELGDAELESIAGGWSKDDGNGGGTQIICCGGCAGENTNFESHHVGCMT